MPARWTTPRCRRSPRSRTRCSGRWAPTIQWVQSYVSDDKITCVYYATDADVIREHARRGGFPVDVIELVHATIDPTTAAPLA